MRKSNGRDQMSLAKWTVGLMAGMSLLALNSAR